MAVRQLKPKKKPKRRAPVAPKVFAEHEFDRLTQVLSDMCASNQGLDTVLQFDFIGGRCVLRVAQGDRLWLKVTDGPWYDAYLTALTDRGLVELVGRATLGMCAKPLPALLGQ